MHRIDTPQRRALIIGGGVAGPALALFLQRAGVGATVFEARSAADEDAGFFLNLGPNGVNVLKMLGIDAQAETDGFPTLGMAFYNGGGRRIAAIDSRDEEQRYGAQSVIMKRSRLHKALRDRATRHGIRVEHQKKLVGIELVDRLDAGGCFADGCLADGQQVVAHFEDGTFERGDLLIGADGLHSRTRQLILPDAPGPAYSGFVDCGGFAYPSPPLPVTGSMQMTFGRRAFFGSVAKPDGEVCWFSNLHWPQEPGRGELAAISEKEWRRRLLDAHGDDHEPIPTLIRSTPGELGRWGVYELPSLPTWHRGPVCLIGDAAHAASPHLGQGASMALEDALVLARCLRDVPDLERSFATFEALRRERVEKIVEQARRNGQQKAITNPVGAFIRDLLLPLFIRLGGSLDSIYDYRLEWETPVEASSTLPGVVHRTRPAYVNQPRAASPRGQECGQDA
jgi:2-polyprenyl-6-methoxyphenol hydroxylase-like FAD-dependent oxidoreductase